MTRSGAGLLFIGCSERRERHRKILSPTRLFGPLMFYAD